MNNIPESLAALKGKRYDIEGSVRYESLLEHSLKVAEEARRQILLCLKTDGHFTEYLKDMAWLCGYFHDIGKSTPKFQDYLADVCQESGNNGKRKGQSEPYERFHNIAGAILFHNLVKVSVSGNHCYPFQHNQIATRSILYHYPIPYIRKDKNEPFVIEWNEIYGILARYMVDVANNYLNCIKVEYVDPHEDFWGNRKDVRRLQLDSENVPKYYSTNPGNYTNIFNFILDQAVKMSDVVASNPMETPLEHFNRLHQRSNEISPSDIERPEGYDERYELQCEYADRLAGHNVSLFNASTGFGKTGAGLHYILSQKNGKRKAFWVCPRNTIAKSVYDTLLEEIRVRGLTDKVTVALLLTNDWKKGDKNADIIVTNIDNFLRPVIKNDVIQRTFGMLSAVCVFDEFHEYVGGGSSLMAMFDVVLRSRELTNSKTLLLSATPATLFETIGGKNSQVYREEHVDDKIAGRVYNLSYGQTQITKGLKNTLYQVYSRQTAQDIFKSGYTDEIFHSCYLPSDKKNKLNDIKASHGKESKDKSSSYVTTNIISTGVDVDFGNLITNLPSPDSLIQSLGRCNRWFDGLDNHKVVVTEDSSMAEMQTIRSMFGTTDIHTTFYEHLRKELPAGRHTFDEICKARESFYLEYSSLYQNFFNTSLIQSYCRLADFSYEYIPEIGERTDEHFVSNNVLRSDGVTEGFWCRLYGKNGSDFSEVFCADTQLINLLNQRSRNELQKIFTYHKKKVKPNLTAPEKNMCDNKSYEELIRYFIKKAHSSKYPFHIKPSFYHYSTKYGLIKVKRSK